MRKPKRDPKEYYRATVLKESGFKVKIRENTAFTPKKEHKGKIKAAIKTLIEKGWSIQTTLEL